MKLHVYKFFVTIIWHAFILKVARLFFFQSCLLTVLSCSLLHFIFCAFFPNSQWFFQLFLLLLILCVLCRCVSYISLWGNSSPHTHACHFARLYRPFYLEKDPFYSLCADKHFSGICLSVLRSQFQKMVLFGVSWFQKVLLFWVSLSLRLEILV